MTTDILDRLRDVARYTPGKDLVARMLHTEQVCQDMRDALGQAVVEIERLRAELQEIRANAVR